MKQFPASAIFVWSITYQKDIIEHILEYTLSKKLEASFQFEIVYIVLTDVAGCCGP